MKYWEKIARLDAWKCFPRKQVESKVITITIPKRFDFEALQIFYLKFFKHFLLFYTSFDTYYSLMF